MYQLTLKIDFNTSSADVNINMYVIMTNNYISKYYPKIADNVLV